MAFSVKDWVDGSGGGTPINAAALEDLETRLSGYTDTQSGLLIPKSLVDAKGDLVVATANDTPDRLAAGADGSALVADSAQAKGLKWETSPHAVYKDLTEWLKSYIGSGAAANTYLMYGSSGIALSGVNSAFPVLPLDPADYAAGSRTTKLRIKAMVITNSVAPGTNFTFHLYPVSTFAGGSNVGPTITALGASLGNVAINTPASGGATAVAVSADFNFPTAGNYVLACVTSGTNAVNAIPQYMAKLQMRQV